jgi:SAM-dependent methyltransferase
MKDEVKSEEDNVVHNRQEEAEFPRGSEVHPSSSVAKRLHPYTPGLLGRRSVLPLATGLKGLYLRLFGIPDVRAQLSASYALAAVRRAAPRSLLDLGCGNGMITCLLASEVPEMRVVGVDLDADGLAFAKRLAEANGLSNVTFRPANAEHDELPGPSAFVLSLAVFQFIHDVPALARRLHDVLEPGGTLALQLTRASTKQYLNRLSRVRGALPQFREARGGFTEEGVSKVLAEAGFEIVEIRQVIKTPSILAKELFYAALSAGGPARYLVCPILNWVTVFDRWYPGRGNGIFLVARRSW